MLPGQTCHGESVTMVREEGRIDHVQQVMDSIGPTEKPQAERKPFIGLHVTEQVKLITDRNFQGGKKNRNDATKGIAGMKILYLG